MKIDRNFLLSILIMLGVIAIHFVIVQIFMGIDKPYFMPIYIFTGLVFMVTLVLVQLLEKSFKQQLGFMFLVIVALKLLSAKLFMNKFPEYKEDEFKFSFLVLYMMSLILITLYTAQKLLKSEK